MILKVMYFENLIQYEDYVKGKMTGSTTGFGIEVGPEVTAKIDAGGSDLRGTIPSMFTRSWESNDEVNNIRKFFLDEQGSISVTEAICLTHRIDIADASKKKLLNGFIESVKSLEAHAEKSEVLKKIEFKRFINEFGTHYATTSKLGTRMTMERRYTARERTSTDKNDVADCASKKGAEVLGLQMEVSKSDCANTDLLTNRINSTKVERMVVSTYGSFLADSLADWSQQVVSLGKQIK